MTCNKRDAVRSSSRPTKEELREAARAMHLEDPEQTEEEWYETLEFASYAAPTLEERISMLWRRTRLIRDPRDIAELKRLFARRKATRTRDR